MAENSLISATKMLFRGFKNYFIPKPLVISFEVTHNCVCNCLHCDKGGPSPNEKRMKPEEYRPFLEVYKPVSIQISGGEPLWRDDIYAVVENLRSFNDRVPYIVFVTNGALLTEEKFVKLTKLGVNQFSVSLDFPDERHDDFRRYWGLYKHLSELIPRIAKLNISDIVLNMAITHSNFREAVNVARRASEWGVAISYSAYSMLRTGNPEFCITEEEDLDELNRQIMELIKIKRKSKVVRNPERVLLGTYEFFKNGGKPNCSAGVRFFVVRPDGKINPCSMFPDVIYDKQEDLINEFVSYNKCDKCYVAIRAYSDGGFFDLLKDSVATYFSR
ncbi:MAG: radical SAM/SPASM domain-containing protein [bacterium]